MCVVGCKKLEGEIDAVVLQKETGRADVKRPGCH